MEHYIWTKKMVKTIIAAGWNERDLHWQRAESASLYRSAILGDGHRRSVNEVPPVYGRYRSVHKRFDAWSAKGIWNRLFEYFTDGHDGEWVMIDSTVARAHPCASGYEKDGNEKQALGRSKGSFTSKIHALVDALGNPLRFRLTEASAMISRRRRR